MRDAEHELLEESKAQFSLATSVHDPLLLDFLLHLGFAIEWEEHFVHTLHQGDVLVLAERVAGSVRAWLVVEQLPISAADALEFWMVHNLAVACLSDDIVVHKFYSAFRR